MREINLKVISILNKDIKVHLEWSKLTMKVKRSEKKNNLMYSTFQMAFILSSVSSQKSVEKNSRIDTPLA